MENAPELKLGVVPRDGEVSTEVLVSSKGPELALNRLTELLTRLEVPDEIRTRMVTVKLIVKVPGCWDQNEIRIQSQLFSEMC